MPETRPVSAAAARRFLALRQLVAPPRAVDGGPEGVMAVFERIGSLQFDPIDVAGRNHDLVLHARVAGYRRAWTDALLYDERRLFEAYNKGLSLLPTAELPWYRITWDRDRVAHEAEAFVAHAELVDHLLDRIRREGPLSSVDFEAREAIDWYWRPTNQVRAILEALGESGILGFSRRVGNRRVYDLVERLFPAELLARRPPPREQFRHRLLSRYRAHGLLGTSGQAELWYGTSPSNRSHQRNPVDGLSPGAAGRAQLLADLVADGELVPVAVEGVRGARHVVAGELPLIEQAERELAEGGGDPGAGRPAGQSPGVAFLAPLDPLAWDRDLLRSLFGFDYVWEVYVPPAKRRWGYYVLPILFGDRFVGRIEPRVDRRAGTVSVVGLWWEAGFEPLEAPGFVEAFGAALEAYRGFAEAGRVTLPRDRRSRALARALRGTIGAGTGNRESRRDGPAGSAVGKGRRIASPSGLDRDRARPGPDVAGPVDGADAELVGPAAVE